MQSNAVQEPKKAQPRDGSQVREETGKGGLAEALKLKGRKEVLSACAVVGQIRKCSKGGGSDPHWPHCQGREFQHGKKGSRVDVD